jgi:hypothetical protein
VSNLKDVLKRGGYMSQPVLRFSHILPIHTTFGGMKLRACEGSSEISISLD